MSDPKVKPVWPPKPSITGMYVPWRITEAVGDESVRWHHVDGRWVAITIGHGSEAGHAVVTSSDGKCETCESYEAALAFAKTLRTLG